MFRACLQGPPPRPAPDAQISFGAGQVNVESDRPGPLPGSRNPTGSCHQPRENRCSPHVHRQPVRPRPDPPRRLPPPPAVLTRTTPTPALGAAQVALAYNIVKIVQLQTGACPDPDLANNDQTQYCYKPVAPYRDHRPATALLLGPKQPEKLDRPKHRPPHRYASGARM